jgi:hypothetical protein
MWTKETAVGYDRSRLRYPSDLTDEEWALVEPLIAPAKRGGNKRTVDVPEVVKRRCHADVGCGTASACAALIVLPGMTPFLAPLPTRR